MGVRQYPQDTFSMLIVTERRGDKFMLCFYMPRILSFFACLGDKNSHFFRFVKLSLMLPASSPRHSSPLLSSLNDSSCACWLAVESALLIIRYLLTLSSPLVCFSLRVCRLGCVHAFHCLHPLFKDIFPVFVC